MDGSLSSSTLELGTRTSAWSSQVALLNIIHNIRELFGPDTGEPVPQVYLSQITSFSRQLDQWVGRWSTALPRYVG